MEKSTVIGTVAVIVVIGAVVGGLWYADRGEAPKRQAQAELARCLSDQGVIFYGAFWCPNCAEQKELFGSAADDLPYLECSTPDRSAQLPVCADEGITGYPTWEFTDGIRCTGTVDPYVLAYRAGCPLPEYGEERTAVGLYERIVEDPIRKRFARTVDPERSLEEELERARTMVDLVLKTADEAALETATPEQLLGAVSTVVYGCGVPSAADGIAVESVSEPGAAVESVPVPADDGGEG